jgi:ankyrin repeat protein
LHLAIDHNRIETARWLLEHGAQFNRAFAYLGPPLARAAARGNLPIAELLLAKGAKPNLPFVVDRKWRTPLDRAHESRDADTAARMQALLRAHGAKSFEEQVAAGDVKLP